MKPRKLTRRMVIVALVLLVGIYYLYPTFRYSQLKTSEESEAQLIAEKMGVSFPFVIEALYREDSALLDRLQSSSLDVATKSDVEARVKRLQSEYREKLLKYRKNAIKQGLDLQGGMHLVLEVDVIQFMRNLARQRDGRLDGILKKVEEKLNADATVDFETAVTQEFATADVKLSQYYGEPGASNSTVMSFLSKQADDAINRSLEILRNRIDQFGVSEPTIQKQGSRRIVLELPGVQDQTRARDLIGRTALLEFKIVAEQDKIQSVLTNLDKFLSNRTGVDAATATTPAATTPKDTSGAVDLGAALAGDTTKKDTSASAIATGGAPFTSMLKGIRGDMAVPVENVRKLRDMLVDPAIQAQIPDGFQFLWSANAEMAGDGKEYQLLYLVKKNAEMTGAALSDARVDISGGSNSMMGAGQSTVSLEMNRQGSKTFARVTGANVQKRLAIVLDDKIYMAPVIRNKIPYGRAVIEGMKNVDEANDLAIVLRAGSLPTSVVIEEERTVGPSLGRDSIRKGLASAFWGGILVMAFMLIYYKVSGSIADLALLLNVMLMMSGLALFGAAGLGATLSLPGIAGIALTIGMAVDSNVLILERIREEMEAGKTVFHAISTGYDRAFVTIFDTHVTTLISGLVLLQFGTGPIRGFAVTLCIGLIVNLFTSVVVTRLIYDWMTSRRTLTTLSI